MKFHDLTTIEELHVEITNKCNAACPMCSRNVYGGKDKANLALVEWTIEDADRVFSKPFEKLSKIVFCGTHGDPVAAQGCLEIIELAKRKTAAAIELYSNSSIRSINWWSDLGKIFSSSTQTKKGQEFDLGVFSIDGLSDTNHLYRRRTSFEKIIANAEAFIKSGGRARWDFLVFKHNEHQVLEAESLAKKMGFSEFRIRKTTRFAFSPDGPEKHRVINKSGEIEYYLEPPTNSLYVNENKKKYDEHVKKEFSQSHIHQKISCLNKTKFNRMYVNAHLEVFPCCFLSSTAYLDSEKLFNDFKYKVLDKYKNSFNSLKLNSWADILDHPWFSKELVESWESPEKSLMRCQRTCSVNLDPITSQSKNKIL